MLPRTEREVRTFAERATRTLLAAVLSTLLAGCGDKVPQSEAAKQMGNAPKQAVDKATQDTAKALQQGADRTREADQKSE